MRQKYCYILPLLTVLFILSSYKSDNRQNKLIHIPIQTLDLYKIIRDTNRTSTQTINAFDISSFVTYKEYKEYLTIVEKDSSQQFYLTQLPDTNIAPREIYEKYISSSDYDGYPVLGISWDNAMNFCKWKTLKDNSKDSIAFIYRLPNCSEWLAAYSFLSENKIPNDFNEKYSDWLINSKDESVYDLAHDIAPKPFIYDWVYFHTPKDPLVLKRKLVIGNSYLYQQEHPLAYSFSYYSNEGYRQISFRLVREDKINSKSILEFWKIKTK